MQPIHRYHQSEHIKADPQLPLAVSLFGRSESVSAVGMARLLEDVESGHWDRDLRAPVCGIEGRSLLLTFLGSRWACMVNDYGKEDPDPTVAQLARAMVAHGADPLARDNAGRDCLDQAFVAGEVALVKEWMKLLPDPSQVQSRLSQGGMQNRPALPWLHQAAHAGDAMMVRGLLAAGLPVNQLTATGETALFWASDPEVVEVLVGAGCDPLHRNDDRHDAKVFWSTVRRLPQSAIAPMLVPIPKPAAGKVGRAQTVEDFYAAALTGGKGALAPILSKLKLQPGEVDKQGFGLLGNLGSRLLDKGSTINQIEVNKATKWAHYLLSDPKIRAQASMEDWCQLFLGVCRFGIHRFGSRDFRPDPPLRDDPQFYRQVVDRIPSLAEQLSGLSALDLARNAAFELLDTARATVDPVAAQAIASLAPGCLALAGKWQGQHNANPFCREQEHFLKKIAENPHLRVEQTSQAWEAALVVDSAHQTLTGRHPRLHVPLLHHLRDAGTPHPATMAQLLSDAAQVLSGAEQQVIADLHAQMIASGTPQVSSSTSRPRL